MNLMLPTAEKRLDSEFYVEGFATTFNDPYILYEFDGIQYKEQVDRNAFQSADLSDVIMQYDHSGRVYARNKMGGGKPPSLITEPQASGFFIAADLSRSDGAKQLYADMVAGLIYKMSWAFSVAEDAYDRDTHTRTILRVKKVYDVSAVSYPANPNTDISARSWLDGVIEAERREASAQLELAKAKFNFWREMNHG